jgi:hypothetical protein
MRSTASFEPAVDFVSLARALSAADARLVVWKGGRDLEAQGDLDCSAPQQAWPALAGAFEAWGRERGLGAAIACEHVIGQLVLVGCGGSAGMRLVQVDLVGELLVHGAPVWRAEDAGAASVRTAGVAHTLPGAEGVLRALADRSDPRVSELVASDPSGAARVSRRLGLRGRLAVGSRGPLEALLVARPLLHLGSLARALRSNRGRNACPVLRALHNERTLDEPLEQWLEAVTREHEVRWLQR